MAPGLAVRCSRACRWWSGHSGARATKKARKLRRFRSPTAEDLEKCRVLFGERSTDLPCRAPRRAPREPPLCCAPRAPALSRRLGGMTLTHLTVHACWSGGPAQC